MVRKHPQRTVRGSCNAAPTTSNEGRAACGCRPPWLREFIAPGAPRSLPVPVAAFLARSRLSVHPDRKDAP
jgi:hypothetical protein